MTSPPGKTRLTALWMSPKGWVPINAVELTDSRAMVPRKSAERRSEHDQPWRWVPEMRASAQAVRHVRGDGQQRAAWIGADPQSGPQRRAPPASLIPAAAANRQRDRAAQLHVGSVRHSRTLLGIGPFAPDGVRIASTAFLRPHQAVSAFQW